MGFFNDTMTDATTQARALLLAMLRDRHPGDEVHAALVDAMGSYLRLNPDDGEMKEAWDKFVGHPVEAEGCAHNGFLKGEGGNDTVNSQDGVSGNDTLDGGLGTDTKVTDATEKSIVGFP